MPTSAGGRSSVLKLERARVDVGLRACRTECGVTCLDIP